MCLSWIYIILLAFSCDGSLEPHHKQPVLEVSKQVRHKPACSGKTANKRLDIFNIETRDIVLSMQQKTKVLSKHRSTGNHVFCRHSSLILTSFFSCFSCVSCFTSIAGCLKDSGIKRTCIYCRFRNLSRNLSLSLNTATRHRGHFGQVKNR